MTNAMANIMIEYIDKILDSHDKSNPITVSIYNCGIEKNETWMSLSARAHKDIISVVLKHYQEQYTISRVANANNGQYIFTCKHITCLSKEEAIALQMNKLQEKQSTIIPKAINECISYANGIIKNDATNGNGSTTINLSCLENNMSKDLSYKDKCYIYNNVWQLFSEAGYYIHETEDPCKVFIVWDEECEIKYRNETASPEPEVVPEPKKLRRLFGGK